MKKSFIYPILAALLLAVVAFLFFAPDDYQGNVLQQHDIMQGLANGQETQQYEAATGHASRWTNSLFGGMPTFQISPTYSANKLMGWIFTVYSLGLPSPANLLFIMMLGFFIMGLCMRMRWYIALFGAIAWGFSSYFIIIIGAGHIWKFITLAYIPPTIGGLSLIYRGKYLSGSALTALFAALQLQSNHPQMTYYFCFLILMMIIAWGVIAWREKRFPQWVKASLCTLAAGILALAANSASLYNSYEYAKETIRGRSTEIVSPDRETAASATGMDRDAITAWSYGLDETFSLLIPNVKGGATIKPVGGANTLLSVGDTDTANRSYLSPEEMSVVQNFPQYFGDQPMTNGPVYVGALVLLLAILAMLIVDGKWESPLKWALFAGAILSILLSWGHNFPALTNLFIDYFPAYNKFRTVSSILVVLEFCVPLLAALALRKIISTPDFYANYKWVFFTTFGLGAAICLLGWISPSIFGNGFSTAEMNQLQSQGIFNDPAYTNLLTTIRQARLDLVSADSLRSLLFILAGGIIIFLYIKRAVNKPVILVGALTAIVLLDLFSLNKRYVNSDNFVEPFPAEEGFAMTEADRMILEDTTDYRVIDLQDFDGARSSYFHKTIGGYHAAKLTRYNDLLTYLIRPAKERLMKSAHDNAARLQTLAADSTVNPDSVDQRLFAAHEPILDMLNTRYYLYGDYAEENPDALGNAWFVDNIIYAGSPNQEMQILSEINPAITAVADEAFEPILGQGAPKAAGDTIFLTSYSPDELTYHSRSAKGGIAVFSEIFFPWGWSATIDENDTPLQIGRADYTLRALRIPAGEHKLTMRFNPTSLSITNILGVAAVIIIFTLCAWALIRAILRARSRSKIK